MSDSLEALRNRVNGAHDIQAVVRTMKAMSASSITQYENAVQALDSYYSAIEQGLIGCLKQPGAASTFAQAHKKSRNVAVIVFGSDQGLVGQFNDSLATLVEQKSLEIGGKQKLWVVGERMHSRLQDSGFTIESCFNVPGSVDGITPLIGQLLIAIEHLWATEALVPLYLFHHRPEKQSGQYKPIMHQLLPLDFAWQNKIQSQVWNGASLPETLGNTTTTLRALISEYLFVSMYQTCAESLSSENASRLKAMQRAEKNIEEMLTNLQQEYHHQRQEAIDAELFDVVLGYSSEY